MLKNSGKKGLVKECFEVENIRIQTSDLISVCLLPILLPCLVNGTECRVILET